MSLIDKLPSKLPLNRSARDFYPAYDILTNMDCNLACTYCFEQNKCHRTNDLATTERYLRGCYTRDYVSGNKPLDVGATIGLIGGESFMYPDYIQGLCEIAQKLDAEFGVTCPFTVVVSTNGTLLKEPQVIDLLKRWSQNFYLGFSIDGTKENHDACRVDHAGQGSYDRAIEGLRIAQAILPPCKISAKATFTHATIDRYAEGVINLIELGFKKLGANLVYEEVWTQEDAPIIAAQLMTIADYMIEKGLVNTVQLRQLNPNGSDPRNFNPYIQKDSNWCGSCRFMRCLGFDGLVYGCHRFTTMADPMPIGHLDGENIVIDDEKLIEEVSQQYKTWPEQCRKCQISAHCPSCSVIAYEYDREHPERYFERLPQCGWTVATVAARLYFKQQLLELDKQNENQS